MAHSRIQGLQALPTTPPPYILDLKNIDCLREQFQEEGCDGLDVSKKQFK